MLKDIKSVKKYFKLDASKKKLIFTGNKLVVHIPKRYEVYGLLDIGNTITTMGIVNLIINDKEQAGLMLLALLEMEYSENLEEVEINGLTYLVVTLHKGDVFMNKTQVIQTGNIAYAMFIEFISLGKLPYFIDHDNSAFLFDSSGPMTGSKLDVEHVIFELICAHLSRDPDNIDKFYRHTNMKKPSKRIMLRSVAHGPESTTAKLLGSYFGDGLTSALTADPTDQHSIEDMLRT